MAGLPAAVLARPGAGLGPLECWPMPPRGRSARPALPALSEPPQRSVERVSRCSPTKRGACREVGLAGDGGGGVAHRGPGVSTAPDGTAARRWGHRPAHAPSCGLQLGGGLVLGLSVARDVTSCLSTPASRCWYSYLATARPTTGNRRDLVETRLEDSQVAGSGAAIAGLVIELVSAPWRAGSSGRALLDACRNGDHTRTRAQVALARAATRCWPCAHGRRAPDGSPGRNTAAQRSRSLTAAGQAALRDRTKRPDKGETRPAAITKGAGSGVLISQITGPWETSCRHRRPAPVIVPHCGR